MKALTLATFILWFLCPSGGYCQTYTESVETLQFEVDNLRDQIIYVIRDVDLNLREADSKVEAMQARVRFLEKENRDMMSLTDVRKSKNGVSEKAQKEIAQLKLENKDLWDELEKSRVGSSTKNHQLLTKLKESQDALTQSENEKAILRKQVESMRTYASQHQEAIQASMTTTYEENQRLSSELNSLKEQLSANTSYVGSNVAEREKLMTETAHFKAKYDSILFINKAISAVKRSKNKPDIRNAQVIDSLKFANIKLQEIIFSLSQTDNIKQSQVTEIDLREKQLKLNESRILVREQMITARENDITYKLQELDAKETRFQNLQEKETQLKLLEQKLRALLEQESNSEEKSK